MRILFLHPNSPDYLCASLFHGLREIYGANCVDLPRFDCMYAPIKQGVLNKIRGHGFSLYGLLEDMPELEEERFFIWQKNIADFDLYIIADIWNSWRMLDQLLEHVDPRKILIVDSGDTNRFFPWNNLKTSWPGIWRKRKLLTHCLGYAKREIPARWSEGAGPAIQLLPISLYKTLLPDNILPISFGIPACKISYVTPAQKTQRFTTHIVDADIASALHQNKHSDSYAFTNEQDYYADIRKSMYGITTKRSGWDCLRHYELAANGAVLCFKQLKEKPVMSAPHGLNESNSICYTNFSDLEEKLNAIAENEYKQLLQNSYRWIEQYTTAAVAQRLIASIHATLTKA